MNPESMCMGCMTRKIIDTPVCLLCDYDESERRSPIVLQHRTLLDNQYVVGRVLGKPGGFGITYLGWDTRLETKVAIKEYLPRDNVGRDLDRRTVVPHSREDGEIFRYGLDAFLQEARTVAKFNHTNLVRVRTFFEANRTAYLVMDYYDGMSLESYIISKGGKLSEISALNIMIPILNGLSDVHEKGFLHRDIKPQNIYLSNDGTPILLDFGAARFAMGERSRSLSVVLTSGYAPYEQYHRKGKQGKWTDIYACGATLYRMVTGKAPIEATERKADDELMPPNIFAQVSKNFTDAVMQALEMEPEDRPQSIQQFQNILLQQTRKEPKLRNLETPSDDVIKEVTQREKRDFKAGDLIDGPLQGMKFAYIPPGEFMMGSPKDEPDREDKETQHRVRLTKDFYIQTTVITVAQWRCFATSTGYKTEAEIGDGSVFFNGKEFVLDSRIYWANPGFLQTDNHPVTCISWNDTQHFIEWLNSLTNVKYRLPTEAEWEYACRAGTTGAYAGSLDAMGWYLANSGGVTHSVAEKQPNAWNLYDIHGNVWEWCQDWYGNYPFGAVTNPIGPGTGSHRAMRGGCWTNMDHDCRSAIRNGSFVSYRGCDGGFRLVCSAGHQ